jgi:hypothetical protein
MVVIIADVVFLPTSPNTIKMTMANANFLSYGGGECPPTASINGERRVKLDVVSQCNGHVLSVRVSVTRARNLRRGHALKGEDVQIGPLPTSRHI